MSGLVERLRVLAPQHYLANVDYSAPMHAAADHIEALEAEVAGYRAARIAYASEFADGADGEPDTGSIHQNIRTLKAEVARLREALTESVEIVHKAYVAATMESVNAGPASPVAKQIDQWRLRCVLSEETSRSALSTPHSPASAQVGPSGIPDTRDSEGGST